MTVKRLYIYFLCTNNFNNKLFFEMLKYGSVHRKIQNQNDFDGFFFEDASMKIYDLPVANFIRKIFLIKLRTDISDKKWIYTDWKKSPKCIIIERTLQVIHVDKLSLSLSKLVHIYVPLCQSSGPYVLVLLNPLQLRYLSFDWPSSLWPFVFFLQALLVMHSMEYSR